MVWEIIPGIIPWYKYPVFIPWYQSPVWYSTSIQVLVMLCYISFNIPCAKKMICMNIVVDLLNLLCIIDQLFSKWKKNLYVWLDMKCLLGLANFRKVMSIVKIFLWKKISHYNTEYSTITIRNFKQRLFGVLIKYPLRP